MIPQECASVVAVATVSDHLDDAEAAWVALDDVAMDKALDQVKGELPCVADTVSPALAARYHRANALRDWGAGRDALARVSLGALARIAPGEPLPADLVPEGHALHDALAAARPGPPEAVQRPRGGAEILFDGTVTLERPGDPTIAQLRQNGKILFTAALDPASPLPPYDLARDPVPTRFFVGGGLGLVAGATLGAAYAARSSFDGFRAPEDASPPEAYDRLLSKRTTVNGLVVASAATLAAGVVVAVIPW